MLSNKLHRQLLLQRLLPTLIIGTVSFLTQRPVQAVTFNFSFAEGTSLDVINGVEQAGLLWGAHLKDDVTVNVNFEFDVLSEGYLGGARPDMIKVNYADAVTQFGLDQLSSDDQSAVANLPTYTDSNGDLSISRLINGTKDAFGFWHTDTSTQNLWLTRANAKSLGIVAGNDTAIDAAIRLNSQVNWDFDAGNGIENDQYDFLGTVLHELGHTLGFMSGVDVLDANVKQHVYLSDTDYDYITSMDLFRRSDSTKGKEKIDWTVDSETEYFSVDGGQERIADFTNGSVAFRDADDFQLSHFRESTDSVMSPILYAGSQSSISDIDLRLMDAIGWDLAGGSQVDYKNGTNTYANDGQSFDGALSRGSWSSTSYNNTLWQEGAFLASTVGDTPTSQEVPEPSSLLGLSAIALLGIKKLRQ